MYYDFRRKAKKYYIQSKINSSSANLIVYMYTHMQREHEDVIASSYTVVSGGATVEINGNKWPLLPSIALPGFHLLTQ